MHLMAIDYVMTVKMVFEGILLPLVGLFGLAGNLKKQKMTKSITLKTIVIPQN